MSHPGNNSLMVAPTLSEAVGAVFTDVERDTLKGNLRTEQMAQARYLRAHPELRTALLEGMRRILESQPADPLAVLTAFFMSDDFAGFQNNTTPT